MCQSKEQGGQRCLGYYRARQSTTAQKLFAITAKIQKHAEFRNLCVAKDLSCKQKKRDIRANSATRTLSEADAQEVSLLNGIIADSDIKRKENNILLAALKWEAAKIASRNLSYEEDLDRRESKTLVHQYTEKILGKALFVGEYEVHSPEWHEQRSKGIGGSDVSIIMGNSPFTKPEKLFLEKTGQVRPRGIESTTMALGTAYEPIIQRRFAESHPEFKVWDTKGSWVSTVNPNQLANIDGLFSSDGSETPDSILEIKAVSEPAKWADKPPLHYRQQILWYMDTFGLKKGKIAVLIDQYQYREYDIFAELGEMEEVRATVAAFSLRVEEFKK